MRQIECNQIEFKYTYNKLYVYKYRFISEQVVL